MENIDEHINDHELPFPSYSSYGNYKGSFRDFPKVVTQIQLLIRFDGKLYGINPQYPHLTNPDSAHIPFTIQCSLAQALSVNIPAQYHPNKLIATIITSSKIMLYTRMFYIHEGIVPEGWGEYTGEYATILELHKHYGIPLIISNADTFYTNNP